MSVLLSERALRTVKERMRAIECGLPFKCALRIVNFKACFVVSRFTLSFPSSEQSGGASPRELVTGIKPAYDRNLGNSLSVTILCSST